MTTEEKITKQNQAHLCTECGKDATLAYVPTIIKRGKRKGEQTASWGGKILPNERVCVVCGRKRGLRFL